METCLHLCFEAKSRYEAPAGLELSGQLDWLKLGDQPASASQARRLAV